MNLSETKKKMSSTQLTELAAEAGVENRTRVNKQQVIFFSAEKKHAKKW